MQFNPKHLYIIFALVFFSECVGPGSTFISNVEVLDSKGNPAVGADVILQIQGQPPITGRTSNLGIASLQIPDEHENQLGEIIVRMPGFKPFRQQVRISPNQLPTSIVIFPSDAPPPTPTSTLPPPTLTPTSTLPSPTFTPTTTFAPTATLTTSSTLTPTSTLTPPTHTPTSTNTPIPTFTNTPGVIFGTRLENACDNFVYAGPDISNERLGDMKQDEIVEIIGRTEMNEWVLVITERNVEGWVDPTALMIEVGDIEDVPVLWNGRVTPPEPCKVEGNSLPTSSCLSVMVENIFLSNDLFDEILFSWTNINPNATILQLDVTGPVGDDVRQVLPSPFIEPSESFLLPRWRFEDGGFANDTEFIYRVTAFDTNNNSICSVAGRFTN